MEYWESCNKLKNEKKKKQLNWIPPPINSHVAPRQLSYQILSNQREAEMSANVSKHSRDMQQV